MADKLLSARHLKANEAMENKYIGSNIFFMHFTVYVIKGLVLFFFVQKMYSKYPDKKKKSGT